eukprot:CAMPEP_0197652580 /NCGR_PEP_ID=MMETSP1338-20131121/34539_1 /TAXON_ID=43686 ORGANISM="Pelagodinium beii, Strain RCC1491" /NCGR_SAMPLE_ID=MMETSP1338 /ASSEMBLY_ACC=CAM_ASM_000754 /LENGTH=231 /DNA_ID=CAMNT_0043227489 /DNA_START=56 /DNA_END=751 /DNA_ORIENTATION=+
MVFTSLFSGTDARPSSLEGDEKDWWIVGSEEENSTYASSERSSSASASPEMVTVEPGLRSCSGMEKALPLDLLEALGLPLEAQEPAVPRQDSEKESAFDINFRINMAARMAALKKAADQCYGSGVSVSPDTSPENPLGFIVRPPKQAHLACSGVVKALDEALWPLLGADVVSQRACEASASLTMYCLDEPRHSVCWHWAKTGACYKADCQYLHLRPYPVQIRVMTAPGVFQ